MANIVVVGTQWGDEGKGKIIDLLSGKADFIVRYQGGNNAGHTVVVKDREFIFHLIPSGILRPGRTCLIGSGVVVDPPALLGEIESVEKQGVDINERNLLISDQAHVILPYHKVLDKLREKKKTTLRIGTTGRGIGPCYADKINRCGIRMADLARRDVLAYKLKLNLAEKNEILRKVYEFEEFSFEDIYRDYGEYGKRLRKYLCNSSKILNEAVKAGKNILFEGAQGTLLDIDHGTYPYVTSSNSTVGGACTGTGVGPTNIDYVIGIAKAYTTRVGEGPFPTEFPPELLKEIRLKGKEFGATTGRPRRCGWFDAVAVNHSAMVNGLEKLVLTKLDVLDDMETIKVCTSYQYKGKTVRDFPADIESLSECIPIYEEHPGWLENTTITESFDDLPANAKNYVKRLSELTGVKISMVSIGSERTQTLEVP